MRSELITGALKYVPNRYQLTHLAAKAVRKLHRPNARIADTANEVLLRFSLNDPMACGLHVSSARTTESAGLRTVEQRRVS